MKKMLIIVSILLIISYTTGVFVEITVPNSTSVSPEIPSFVSSFFRTVKDDISTLVLSVFFALTAWLFPCVVLFLLCKAFALGFSSAFLLSGSSGGTNVLLSVLLPRAILKLPVYVLLFYLSFEITQYAKDGLCKHYTKKENLTYLASRIALGFIFLIISSLTEVVLMQIIL